MYRYVAAAKQPAVRRGDLVTAAAELEALLLGHAVLRQATVRALPQVCSVGIEAMVDAHAEELSLLIACEEANLAWMYALRECDLDSRRLIGALHLA